MLRRKRLREPTYFMILVIHYNHGAFLLDKLLSTTILKICVLHSAPYYIAFLYNNIKTCYFFKSNCSPLLTEPNNPSTIGF